jgi:hypothetical protein
MANLSNINNILRVSSSGVGINKNNTGPSELDIESAGADMIDMTRTGQKTYRFAISGASAFSLFDVAANADRLVIDSSGNTTFANRVSAGESFNSVKDGADTVADGPFFALKNASGTRQYINQLDASNNIDYWYYNGSTWTQTISLLNNGGATFAGAITISKTSSADLRLHSSTYSADFNLISGATGANKFGIYDNNGGAYRLLVDSSGNVGIGTTSPSDYFAQNLVINNTAGGITLVAPTNSNSYLMFADGTTGDDQYRGYLEYTHASDKMILRSGGDMQFSAGGSIERMRIDSSGIVSVTNSADAILKVETSSGTSSSRLYLKSPTREWRIGVNDAFNSSSLFFYNTEANTYPFIINTSGNIGIGTTSPLSPLSIQANSGGSALRFIGRSDGISGIDFFNSAQTVANYFQSNGTWIRSRADGGFHFSKGSTPITTDVDGFTIEGMNVGIGTTSPDYKLEVESTSDADLVSIKSTAIANNTQMRLGISGNDSVISGTGGSTGNLVFKTYGSERMRITSGGDVCVGTDTGRPDSAADPGIAITPAGKFYIYSTSDYGVYNTNTTGKKIYFRIDNVEKGTIQFNTNSVAYNTTSDYRLKENVVEMTGALDRVSQLKPSRFNFIGDVDVIVDGFLAHEVQEIVPEAISGEKDAVDEEGNPDYQGIDQSKLVPLLVGAIQELKADNDSLKARIETLENK